MTTSTKTLIQVTAVHMVGGYEHQHIVKMRWRNTTTAVTGEVTRAEMVTYVRDKPNTAYCSDANGQNAAYLQVVNATPSYVRTFADGKWSNNLLSLPRY